MTGSVVERKENWIRIVTFSVNAAKFDAFFSFLLSRDY